MRADDSAACRNCHELALILPQSQAGRAYAHNPNYAIQILHDSLADLAARVPVKNFKRMRRPK